MKLKTVAKLGTIVSVLLFVVAVGYYALMELEATKRNRDANLYALVPDDCIGVLETDNLNAFLDNFQMLNYSKELNEFQFPGLFDFILNELKDYTAENVHGLSNRTNRVLVSFHRPSTPHDQVIYFRMNSDAGHWLADLLKDYTDADFLPKQESYRGKRIQVYPLNHEEYLASYAGSGFLAISYQKSLIERVIDADLDDTSLDEDAVFSQALAKKKSHNFMTLYGRSTSIPLLQTEADCWSEYDFHINSDVLYLTGDLYLSDAPESSEMEALLDTLPVVCEADWILSADRDSTQFYMDRAYVSNEEERILFNECVANLSREAAFTLVTDMERVVNRPQDYGRYLPRFVMDHAALFRPFILSVQLTLTGERPSHIWVFTYKE